MKVPDKRFSKSIQIESIAERETFINVVLHDKCAIALQIA